MIRLFTSAIGALLSCPYLYGKNLIPKYSSASLNLLDELTFGSVGIAHERPISHIIGKSGKEKGVLAISLKHLAELAEVTAKQRIRLLVR